MSTARASHAGVGPPDGRLLVAGGQDANGRFLKSAEIFDSTTNVWQTVADMPSSSLVTGAAVLHRKVYVYHSTETPDPHLGLRVAVFDVDTMAWAEVQPPPRSAKPNGVVAVRHPQPLIFLPGQDNPLFGEE